MPVKDLREHIMQNWQKIRISIEDGTYLPSTVRRVEIPKLNGGTRLLGIPTVTDRFIQQAIAQVLNLLYDPEFSEHSYGFRPNKRGPQGEPLSPLLSNIVLDELDKELEKRGHKLVRYADDCNSYVKSRKAGQRVKDSLTGFIESKLKLKGNEEKSAVDRPWKRKFLGFIFTPTKEPKIRLARQTLNRVKSKIKELTSQSKPVSIEQRVKKLTQYLKGWCGYFALADTHTHLKN